MTHGRILRTPWRTKKWDISKRKNYPKQNKEEIVIRELSPQVTGNELESQRHSMFPSSETTVKAVPGEACHVFVQEGDNLDYTETYQHKIPTTDDVLVSQPFKRIPPTQYQEVKDHIQNLVENGIASECHSLYASPVIISKKDGSMTLCTDYLSLNAKQCEIPFLC